MNRTRILTTILTGALLLASVSVLSCGDNSAKTDSKQTEPSVTDTVVDTASTETESPYKLSLPEDLDFGGEEIFVYGWEHYEDIEFYAETENGDIVNDAVFRRNLSVQENLNVKLTFSEIEGRDSGTWNKKVTNANKAGDDLYDIIAGHSHRIGELAQSNDLLNLLDYQYLDLNQPWWRSELTERAVILNNLFFVTGDISPSSVARSQGIFINTEILHNFDLEDPYQLVIDGTWTHSKMMEMTKGVYSDLDGDGKKNEEGDRFGFALDQVQTQAIGLTAGINSIVRDSEGRLSLSPDYVSDYSTSILDLWIDYMKTSPDAIFIKVMDDTSMFRSGRALFYTFPLGTISTEFRNCDFNIGFVPWPKADEGQEDYVTCTSNAYSLWGVPLAATNPDMSCAVMENLAYEGYREIMPAMFETAYKVKYNNTESQLQSQVFDILRENLTFDIGRIMSTPTGNVFYLLSDCINAGKNNLASQFEKTKKRADKLLNNWMDELENADQ